MIAAIGAFDGFHRGHQALLERARTLAKKNHSEWGVITFTLHPDKLFSSSGFKLLYTNFERRMLEKFFEIPNICEVEFTSVIAGMLPDEFINFISEKFGVTGVVVGEGFRFGKNRTGTTAFIENECGARNWISCIVPQLRSVHGAVISSTAIREAVFAGNLDTVRELQGYPFFCSGRVTHGNERGRTLGFPTANLDMAKEKVVLKSGIYAAVVFVRGEWRVGAANIGVNPTFDDVNGARFEVFLLDFNENIYDTEIVVFPVSRIRDEKRFSGAGELKEQMKLDVAAARKIGKRSLETEYALWNMFRENLIAHCGL